MLLSFRKYQALLNDYILFNAIDGMLKLSPTQIVELCHRRRGIGADGVLVVSREDGQYRMEIFNADGSLATMCGNGLRCVGKFLADTQRIPIGTRIPIRTRAGLRSVTVQQHTPAASHVSASMGSPRIVGQYEFENRWFWHIDVGNPHIVHFLETNPNLNPLSQVVEHAVTIGPGLEHAMKGGVNVGFACTNGNEMALAVWERGAGFTEACGTGATAAVTAARAAGKIPQSTIRVHQRGGDVDIVFTETEQVFLEGVAHFVFCGDVILDLEPNSQQKCPVVSE